MSFTITGNTAATIPAIVLAPSVPELARRTRRSAPHGKMTGQPAVSPIAGDAVSVSLFGHRARGRCMILDAGDWADVSARLTARWVLNENGGGLEYVRTGGQHSGMEARQPGPCPTATLARILVGAQRGERVIYGNGDRLDLRRANLSLEYPRLAGAAA